MQLTSQSCPHRSRGPAAAATSIATDLTTPRQRQCLSREGSGNAGQRQCLSREGSGNTGRRQCLSHEGSGNTSPLQLTRAEPGGSACFYCNSYGTQCNHPAQGDAPEPDALGAHRDQQQPSTAGTCTSPPGLSARRAGWHVNPSGNAGQRQCLSRKGSGSTRQRRCLRSTPNSCDPVITRHRLC